jgi:putative two-component system response regulator
VSSRPIVRGAAAAFAPSAILLDIDLPDIDGLTVCRMLKSSPSTRLTPILMITGRSDRAAYLKALEAGADDFLAKPVVRQELRARLRSAVRMKAYIDELDDAAATLLMLGGTIEARDPYTEGHCHRIGDYASRLGRRLGLDIQDIHGLERGGCLHDLGKIAIPDAVLFKPGRLTPSEFDLIKTHPAVGDRICAPLKSLERVRPIIRSHHERLDGSGYPDGLRGGKVPLLAQITAIVDVYDALTTDRPYRAALGKNTARQILHEQRLAGKHDGVLVEEFFSVLSEAGIP